MYRILALVSMLAALAIAGAVCAQDPDQDPAQDPNSAASYEDLQLVDQDRRGEIYADPRVDWSVYTEILLDPATVAFRKNWERDQNRDQPFKIQASDMERIKTELAELFGEVFTKELTENGGYVMATEAKENVLRITPAIIDLDVYAPDSRSDPSITVSYTRQAGRMTLKLELYDSVTGALIATARDRREAPYRNYMQWTNSVTNRRDAKLMLERWAKELRQRLDQARESGKTSDE